MNFLHGALCEADIKKTIKQSSSDIWVQQLLNGILVVCEEQGMGAHARLAQLWQPLTAH